MRCKGCAQGWVNSHWREDAKGPCTCHLGNPWSPKNYGSHRVRYGIKAELRTWTQTLQVGDRVAVFSDIREKDELGNRRYDLGIAKITRVITQGEVYVDGKPVEARPLFVLNDGNLYDELGRCVTTLQKAYSHFGDHIWATTQMRQLMQDHLDAVEHEYLLKEIKRASWGSVKLEDLRAIAKLKRIAPHESMLLQPLEVPTPV